MKRTTIKLVVVCITLIAQSAFSQNKFTQPSVDASKWANSFYVLLKDDANTVKTQKLVEKVLSRDNANIPIAAFRSHPPRSISTILSMDESKGNKNLNSSNEDARSKLGRYLFITYPQGTDLVAVFNALNNDPEIAYFGVNEPMAPLEPTDSSGVQTLGAATNIGEDRTWGFDLVRAGDGLTLEHGHTIVGVPDLGISPSHPEFIDYIGNTWKGGNFHPALAFNLGGAIGTGGSKANPYTGLAILGEARF